MFVDLTDAQRALQAELRAYFAGLVSAQERAVLLRERHGPVYREVVRRMGRDGWLGVGWPREYGGRGLGQVEQQIFVNEAARADIPLPGVTLQTVGPTLQAHGTPEQKEFFLPRILAGELHFAIGYTEPGAGTDLAALRTRAVRVGDEYIVDGQKTFTTGAHDADYVWLACRTAPDPGPASPGLRSAGSEATEATREGGASEAPGPARAERAPSSTAPRHRGISILIVDTTDPGYSWTPIITCDGAHHVNATYYNGVRVPVGRRVGAENAGWRLVTTQLNHERVMLGPAGRLGALHERVVAWASGRCGPDGEPLLDRPDVRRVLAQTYACLRVNELLNWQVATAETVAVADASATKIFGSERLQRLGQALEEIVGRHGDPADPATADLLTWLDVQAKRNLVLTFGGGVNEIQRELIATAGLGLPRVPR
jgi:3-oxo-4-pregnene-20-carboxyl-CoA dehydrogenase beta subunit